MVIYAPDNLGGLFPLRAVPNARHSIGISNMQKFAQTALNKHSAGEIRIQVRKQLQRPLLRLRKMPVPDCLLGGLLPLNVGKTSHESELILGVIIHLATTHSGIPAQLCPCCAYGISMTRVGCLQVIKVWISTDTGFYTFSSLPMKRCLV